VLGWSEKLDTVWPRSEFDDRWELLPAGSMPVDEFLHSLDLFVYEVRPELSESWGRAVVEAMLCGAVPLVPADPRHHLHRLVPHGEAGFHCACREDFGHYARLLETDIALRDRMSRAARRFAEQQLCNVSDHLSRWRMVFED
jgi:glycosyltransferase involved in cell wall biosynthesis